MDGQAGTRFERPAYALAARKTASVVPALAAVVLGLFILFGVGFAQPDALHNAAHDSRHALAFPCH